MAKEKVLNGVEDTLYIPLISRIYASLKFPEFFYDEKALELKNNIETEKFSEIQKNASEYFYMASVCRQKQMDKKIEKYIIENQKANIIFLGAGLETAYYRIRNKKIENFENMNFYQVDLKEVIDVRKKLLKPAENEELIAGDIFTLDFVKYIDLKLPTLFVVSGVFQYFKEEKVINFIKKIKEIINGELIFDVTNTKGLIIANRYVEKTGNKNAKMYFGIDNKEEFAKKTGTILKSSEYFFTDAMRDCKGLKLKTKIYMYFADKLDTVKIVHLKLN